MPKDDSHAARAAAKAAARSQGPAAEAQAQSLHLAARKGNLPAVRRLLERGTNVDQRSESGKTALHVAAQVDHCPTHLSASEYQFNLDSRQNRHTILIRFDFH